MWYSYDKVLSYNALLNFIIGERGVGKSYGIKKHVVKHFLKTGRKFIYLRRFETELNKTLKGNEFFKDIETDSELIKYKFNVSGHKLMCDGKQCGYAIPLSKASIYKSVPFPDVDYIIYDEFLITTNTYHYLQDEPMQLLDFIETVARLRDNIRVFLLGNNISIVNPYFDYFNITLPYNSDIKTFKKGTILINYIKNQAYRNKKRASRFGSLIDGTTYGAYAIDNEALTDDSTFIKKKSNKAKYLFNIKLNNVVYGVWRDLMINEMYISKSCDLNSLTITLSNNNHDENSILVGKSSNLFKLIQVYYQQGSLFFDNQNIKQNIIPFLNYR